MGEHSGNGMKPRGLVTPDGAPVAPRKRFALECDCGSEELMGVGPYTEQDGNGSGDAGLRWVFTCGRCGESLRLYWTSPGFRARRAALAALALAGPDPELQFTTEIERGRGAFQRGEALPEDSMGARYGWALEQTRARELREAYERGAEQARG